MSYPNDQQIGIGGPCSKAPELELISDRLQDLLSSIENIGLTITNANDKLYGPTPPSAPTNIIGNSDVEAVASGLLDDISSKIKRIEHMIERLSGEAVRLASIA